MSDFDIDPEFGKDDAADPYNDQYGQDEMGPISPIMLIFDISPCQSVQPTDSVALIVCNIRIRRVGAVRGETMASSINIINRYEDRYDDSRHRNEDDQHSLQISKEEVRIETTLVDDFAISESEQRQNQAPWATRRRISSLTLGYEIRLRFTTAQDLLVMMQGYM